MVNRCKPQKTLVDLAAVISEGTTAVVTVAISWLLIKSSRGNLCCGINSKQVSTNVQRIKWLLYQVGLAWIPFWMADIFLQMDQELQEFLGIQPVFEASMLAIVLINTLYESKPQLATFRFSSSCVICSYSMDCNSSIYDHICMPSFRWGFLRIGKPLKPSNLPSGNPSGLSSHWFSHG